jgi:hypothetical protein
MMPSTDYQDGSTLQLAAAQAIQSFIGLFQRERLDFGLTGPGSNRQEFLTVPPSQVGDGANARSSHRRR